MPTPAPPSRALGATVAGLAVLLPVLPLITAAQEPEDNRQFLSDYSVLEPAPDNSLTQYFLAPDATEKLGMYRSIMVDHPEVFIAADSPYSGIRPAHLSVLAESFRARVIEALSASYTVVDEPGAGVLYLRLALVDLSVSKERVHILGYTPIGLAVRAGRQIASSAYDNSVRHLSLASIKIEGEIQDGESGEVLGEFVDDFSGASTPDSWDALQTEMQRFGAVVACQLRNGASPAEARVDCRASP